MKIQGFIKYIPEMMFFVFIPDDPLILGSEPVIFTRKGKLSEGRSCLTISLARPTPIPNISE